MMETDEAGTLATFAIAPVNAALPVSLKPCSLVTPETDISKKTVASLGSLGFGGSSSPVAPVEPEAAVAPVAPVAPVEAVAPVAPVEAAPFHLQMLPFRLLHQWHRFRRRFPKSLWRWGLGILPERQRIQIQCFGESRNLQAMATRPSRQSLQARMAEGLPSLPPHVRGLRHAQLDGRGRAEDGHNQQQDGRNFHAFKSSQTRL